MKKKLLIVTSSLSTGGLEKCLINLCDNFNYEKYEVDLYLFNEGRVLLKKLNKNVKVLDDGSSLYATMYNRPFVESVKTLLKRKKVGLVFYRIGRFIRARLKNKTFTVNDWAQMKKTMLSIDTHYDIAIGFEEGTACYYVADCVNADVKIGWIHTDVKKINNNKKLDNHSFAKLNHVVTVSHNSLKSLQETYPAFTDKFLCINLPRLINEKEFAYLSNEPNKMQANKVNILSVGRLVELKGFHLCVPVCKRLIDNGYNVQWYVAGEGDFRGEIEKEIEKHGIKDNFILLGNCPNPYTYIKSADICVQPSSYEGYSVAVFEEKYFEKAVVVTDIPGNREMIENGVNGIVVQRTVDAIYDGVKKLLDDESLKMQMEKIPVKGEINNQQIMQEIEKLF